MLRVASLAVIASMTTVTLAGDWILVRQTPIDPDGTRPSVSMGTVAYTAGVGGATAFYDGVTTMPVFGPDDRSYDCANAGGNVAWRNLRFGPTRNDIFYWDGSPALNVSNSTDSDTAPDGADNGDVIWTRNKSDLWLYDASTASAASLGINGDYPTVYVTDQGIATYAWQDPTTDEVMYFDGTQVHILGSGAPFGARPSLWDGCITWLDASGLSFAEAEVMFWENGVATHVTEDTDTAIQDDYPRTWNGLVVWQRAEISSLEPRLMVWDGVDTRMITDSRSQYPSFKHGQVAWEDYIGGLYVADLVPIGGAGDCEPDGFIDMMDFQILETCLDGPGMPASANGCTCGDLDQDDDGDTADFAIFQTRFNP
jgi:hypothetical protein